MDWLALDVRMALLASMELRGFEWGLTPDEIARAVPDLDRDATAMVVALHSHVVQGGGVVRLTSAGFKAIANLNGWPRSRLVLSLRRELARLLLDWVQARGYEAPMQVEPLVLYAATQGATMTELQASIVQSNLLGWVHDDCVRAGAPLRAGPRLHHAARWAEGRTMSGIEVVNQAALKPRWEGIYSLVARLSSQARPERPPSEPLPSTVQEGEPGAQAGASAALPEVPPAVEQARRQAALHPGEPGQDPPLARSASTYVSALRLLHPKIVQAALAPFSNGDGPSAVRAAQQALLQALDSHAPDVRAGEMREGAFSFGGLPVLKVPHPGGRAPKAMQDAWQMLFAGATLVAHAPADPTEFTSMPSQEAFERLAMLSALWRVLDRCERGR